jgi:flagellar basal body-associated protein FliL
MEPVILILAIINGAMLTALGGGIYVCWLSQKKLVAAQKILDETARAAANSLSSQAKVIQELSDRVAGLQMQQNRGLK